MLEFIQEHIVTIAGLLGLVVGYIIGYSTKKTCKEIDELHTPNIQSVIPPESANKPTK